MINIFKKEIVSYKDIVKNINKKIIKTVFPSFMFSDLYYYFYPVLNDKYKTDNIIKQRKLSINIANKIIESYFKSVIEELSKGKIVVLPLKYGYLCFVKYYNEKDKRYYGKISFIISKNTSLTYRQKVYHYIVVRNKSILTDMSNAVNKNPERFMTEQEFILEITDKKRELEILLNI